MAADFPERMRAARVAKGWQTHILARKLGTFPSMIEQIQAGDYDPEDELMVGIATDLADLLEIEPPLGVERS